MYDDIREKIETGFDIPAPDLLANIKNAEISKISSEEELFSELVTSQEKDHKGSHGVWYMAGIVAAVFVCMISMFFYNNTSIAGTVIVENDEKVILSVNKSNTIVKVEVEHAGDQSQDFAGLEGKTLDEGLNEVLDSMNKKEKQTEISYHKKGHGKKKDPTRDIIKKVTKDYTERTKKEVITTEQSTKTCQVDDEDEDIEVAEKDEESKEAADYDKQEEIASEIPQNEEEHLPMEKVENTDQEEENIDQKVENTNQEEENTDQEVKDTDQEVDSANQNITQAADNNVESDVESTAEEDIDMDKNDQENIQMENMSATKADEESMEIE